MVCRLCPASMGDFPPLGAARCTHSETFFCGWGTQKHEYGAVRFLMSSIRRDRKAVPSARAAMPFTRMADSTPHGSGIDHIWAISIARMVIFNFQFV